MDVLPMNNEREPGHMGKLIGIFIIAIICLSTYPSHVLARGEDLPDEFVISDYVGKAQSFSLSCESRAAVDLAAFWGMSVSESEFLFNLPSSDNPNVGFVGNPNDPWGFIPPRAYGVHAEPVASLLRDYGLQAEAQFGLSWDDLRAEIASGRPVIVWIIGQMWAGQVREYVASDGEVVFVAPYEHTMTLYGYTPETVKVLDAYSGRKLTYGIQVFLNSWSVLGNMAVFSMGIEKQASTYIVPGIDPYTVVRGDYLVLVAERFHTDWKTLVTLNGLVYPYTLYPGQELRLPDPPLEGLSELESHNEEDGGQVDPTVMDDIGEITHTVKPGDYLSKVANQLGVNWFQLAKFNNITFPYTIYPGQILRWSTHFQDPETEGGSEFPNHEPAVRIGSGHPFSFTLQFGRTNKTWPY